MVDVTLGPHHHLTGRDRLSTCTAGSTVTKQPDVIVPAEDHSSFAEAGAADLSQLSLAAGALKAARVPVPIHGEEQEAIRDATSAACTGTHCPATTSCYRDSGGFHTAVHHRLP